jgi:hypothetical protein
MNSNTQTNLPFEDKSLLISYLTLRKAIGLIGVALPFVLVMGKWLLQTPGIEPSISDYYYTVMGSVFVGSLCSIGVFLLSYKGYEPHDDRVGNLACLFAVGVALFPTPPIGNTDPAVAAIGNVHFTCATAFFSLLAYFSLVLFRKTKSTETPTPQKRLRNRVYATCGALIILAILLIAIYSFFLRGTWLQQFDPVFWLESLAVVSFGVSWLVKGEAILQDSGVNQSQASPSLGVPN